MKARILSLAVIVLLSVAGVYASNSKTKIYSNADNKTKEYTFVDSETLKALKKMVYSYDSEGTLQEKSLYVWDDTQGWTGIQKYSYNYDADKLVTIVYTKWDKNIATWSATSQHILHTYNTDGELLAVKQIEVKDNLIAAQ